MKKLLFIGLLGLFIIGCSKEVEKPKKEETKSEETLKDETQSTQTTTKENEIVETSEDNEVLAGEEIKENEKSKIVLSAFVTDVVENRVPGNEIIRFSLNDTATYYTEFKDIGDEKTVTHQWVYVDENGSEKEIFRKDLSIKGDRWRTWTSKKLHLKGEWRVHLLDWDNEILKTSIIVVKDGE